MCPGQRHESTQLERVLETVRVPRLRGRPRTRPRMLVADKGYDVLRIRRYLRRRGIASMIPERAMAPGKRRRKRRRRPRFDARLYASRNVIERLISWLKEHRRLATRFEKLAESFLAMVKLAFVRRCMRVYFSDTP